MYKQNSELDDVDDNNNDDDDAEEYTEYVEKGVFTLV